MEQMAQVTIQEIKQELKGYPYILEYNANYLDIDDDTENDRITWFYHALHTPPGKPYNPMTDYHMMTYCPLGSVAAYEKIQHPTCRMIRCKSLMGYFYTAPSPITEDEEVRVRRERNKVLAQPFYDDFKGKVWSEIVFKSLQNFEPFKVADYDKLTLAELIQMTEHLEDAYRQMWEWHWLCSGGLGFPYEEWARISKEWLGLTEEDPLFLKLMGGFDNLALKGRRELVRLGEAGADMGLKDIFLNNAAKDVLLKLRQEDGNAKEWLEEFGHYLSEYGWQSPTHIDWSVPGWVDDPSTPIKMIQQSLGKGSEAKEIDQLSKERERKEAEKEVMERLSPTQRRYYARVMQAGRQWHWWNEEHNMFMEQPFNSIGYRHYHNIGKKFIQTGCLENADDIFYLNPTEVKILLQEPYVYTFKARVARRKLIREKAAQLLPPFYLGKVPVETALSWDEIAGDIMETKMTRGRFIAPEEAQALRADLKGLPGSGGMAEGPARVIMSEDQMDEVQEGEILVAPTTSISWTPIFDKIVAAVIDSGGVLSHAACIGREYGIPVIVMTMAGTQNIKTGQKIRVDGDTGAVYILG